MALRGAALLATGLALLAAGCGRDLAVSATDRQAGERFVARAGPPGTPAYEGVLRDCVRNTLHLERGGG
jgi:hypothetical protein